MQTTRSMPFQLSRKASMIGDFGISPCSPSSAKAGVVDLAAYDVARDDDDGTQQEREGDPPAVGVERFRGHEMRDRQNHPRAKSCPACTPCRLKLEKYPLR